MAPLGTYENIIELVRQLSPTGDLTEARQRLITMLDTAASLGSILPPTGRSTPGSNSSTTLAAVGETRATSIELGDEPPCKRARVADSLQQENSRSPPQTLQTHEQHKSTFETEDDTLAKAMGRIEDDNGNEDDDTEKSEEEDGDGDSEVELYPCRGYRDEDENTDEDDAEDDEVDRPKSNRLTGFQYEVGNLKNDLPKLEAQILLLEKEVALKKQQIEDLEEERDGWDPDGDDYYDRMDVYEETMGAYEEEMEDLDMAGRDLRKWKRDLLRIMKEPESSA